MGGGRTPSPWRCVSLHARYLVDIHTLYVKGFPLFIAAYFPLSLTPKQKVYPFIWTEYLDFFSLPLSFVGKIRHRRRRQRFPVHSHPHPRCVTKTVKSQSRPRECVELV